MMSSGAVVNASVAGSSGALSFLFLLAPTKYVSALLYLSQGCSPLLSLGNLDKSLGGWDSCVADQGLSFSFLWLIFRGGVFTWPTCLPWSDVLANDTHQICKPLRSIRMAAFTAASSSSSIIQIAGARAVVEWSKPNGETCVLSAKDASSTETGLVTMDCHYRPSFQSASFRLRAPVLLKGLGRKMTPLFMFIAPERIESLTFDDTHTINGTVRTAMGECDVVTLCFQLRQTSDLVVPPHDSLVPKKKVFWDLFDSLKDLSQQTEFLMYLRRDDVPASDEMIAFCEAVSGGKLTTSTAHADIARLYDGKGGKLLQDEDLAAPASAPLDTPPSYDELGPPPPAPPIEKGKLERVLWYGRIS